MLLSCEIYYQQKNLYKLLDKTRKITSIWFITFVDSTISRYIIACISLIGIVLLSITGALGGAISHGQDTDPIVQAVYSIFIGE